MVGDPANFMLEFLEKELQEMSMRTQVATEFGPLWSYPVNDEVQLVGSLVIDKKIYGVQAVMFQDAVCRWDARSLSIVANRGDCVGPGLFSTVLEALIDCLTSPTK